MPTKIEWVKNADELLVGRMKHGGQSPTALTPTSNDKGRTTMETPDKSSADTPDSTDDQLTPGGSSATADLRQGVAVDAETTDEPLISKKEAKALFAARQRADKAERLWDDAKETAKLLRQEFINACKDVMSIARDAEAGQGRLFPTEPEPDSGDEPAAVDAAADAWRTVELTELGLPNPILADLELYEHEGHGITTLGRLMDMQKDLGNTWDQSVTGIGPAKRQTIDDAIETYFVDPRQIEDAAEEGDVPVGSVRPDGGDEQHPADTAGLRCGDDEDAN